MNHEAKKLKLMPPAASKCQQCAVEHPPEQPHDATSLYYGFWFVGNHGRSPTWCDALAHCSEEVKAPWLEYLAKLGIDPASTKVRGDLTSQAEVEARLNAND